jgi:hypothetical protein
MLPCSLKKRCIPIASWPRLGVHLGVRALQTRLGEDPWCPLAGPSVLIVSSGVVSMIDA